MKHYVMVVQGTQLLKEVEAKYRERGSSSNAEYVKSCKAEGEWLTRYLLDDLHGLAKPMTHPPMLHVLPRLKAWEAELMRIVGLIRAHAHSA